MGITAAQGTAPFYFSKQETFLFTAEGEQHCSGLALFFLPCVGPEVRPDLLMGEGVVGLHCFALFCLQQNLAPGHYSEQNELLFDNLPLHSLPFQEE